MFFKNVSNINKLNVRNKRINIKSKELFETFIKDPQDNEELILKGILLY